MNCKTFALACALLFCCVLPLKAQETKCTLKVGQLSSAPELSGFRLGMTLEQFKARVPKLTLRGADEFGATAINIYPEHEDNIDKPSFAGVRTISLEFLDGRVVMLWVGYAPGFKWPDIDSFLSGMTRSLNVPNLWETKARARQLTCDDFQVTISTIGGNPSIRFVDETAKQTLEDRKAAKEEREEAAKP